MQIKTGIDILDLRRFKKSLERRGKKFLLTFLVEEEIENAQNKPVSLAGLFAAKEAVSKAIGSGIWQADVKWHDIYIYNDELGKPLVELSGGAIDRYDKMNGIDIDISISHEKNYVVAICVILTDSKA
ncbi:MAG TPA: holo-ACP synthase [Clostridiaceae bacterium]|jgi:holo-[acyl-carrier protein] synthase|nr:holo-ACP synthase [Clostridiaceae bacterium]